VLGGRKYGRLYVQFGEPASLRRLAERRLGAAAASLTLDEVMTSPEAPPGPGPGAAGGAAAKRELVQHLANRVAWGISEAITITPVGLLAAALLSHTRRGISAGEVARRVELLRELAAQDGVRLGRGLAGAPSDPRRAGVLADAMARLAGDELVRAEEVAGDVIYLVPDEKRPLLDFHRNAVIHRYVALSLVAAALRSCRPWAAHSDVRERARFLSRLFKLEFMYRVGSTFERIFEDQLAVLERLGAAGREGGGIAVRTDGEVLDFLADLTRPYLEGYRVVAEALRSPLGDGAGPDRKAFLKMALERGRADFLAGRIAHREALSKATLENGIEWLVQQGALEERGGALRLAPAWAGARTAEHVAAIDLLLH
jgi:glycerol-3-phosphate O-acyltransferase